MIISLFLSHRGVILPVVLALIVVALVGVFAWTGFLQGRLHHEEQFILSSIGRNLADSLVSFLHGWVEEAANGHSAGGFSAAFRDAVSAAVHSPSRQTELSAALLDDPKFPFARLAALVAETRNPLKDGEPFQLRRDDLRVSLSELVPLFQEEGLTSLDRMGVMTLEASVGFGSRRVTRRMRLRVKIVDLRLPVLAKFTLAVFDLPKGADGDHYNKSLVSRNGMLSPESPVKPLILNHAGEPGRILSGGWVFLGARDKIRVVLKKAGGFDHYGEMFHFYDKDAGHPEPAAIAARSTPDPDPDLKGMFPTGEEYLAVVNNYWGWHEGMNIHDVFRRHFADEDSLDGCRCSSLRLYGTRSHASPTRVVGEVFQSCPYYAVLATIDPATGLAQYPVGMLRAVEAEEFLDGLVDCFAYHDSAGNVVKGSALLGWPEDMFRADRFFCGKWQVYQYFMSDLWEYPFNFNYEYLNYDRNGFDPRSIEEPRTIVDKHYLVSYDDLRLTDYQGNLQFSGNLMDLSGRQSELLARVLRRKSSVRYDSQAELFRSCLREGQNLEIPGVAFVKQGPLRLEKEYRITRDAMIVLENGDIEFKSGLPRSAGSILTLVTLDGDVRISTSEPVHAGLVALRKGENRGGRFLAGGPFQLIGHLACETLDPLDLKDGGSLSYDETFDPFAPRPMRVYLEDRDMRFDEAVGEE